MDPNFWLCASIALTFLTAVLTLACLELDKLSGGKLRRLEEINKKLADRLYPWFPVQDEWRFAGHAAVIIAFLLMTYCASEWEHHTRANSMSALPPMILPGLLIFVAYILVEMSGTFISLVGTARFLVVLLPLLRLLNWLLYPLTWPLAAMTRHGRQQQATKTNVAPGPTAEDEILSLIETSLEKNGGDSGIEEDERRMILGAFALDQTFVHEIMTPRVDVDGVDEEASVTDLTRLIIETGHSRIPVYSNSIDHILGVIYAKDLLDENKLRRAENLRALAHPAVFIPETKNIGDLLEEFRQSNNQFAIVLDEYGGTAGIVTFEDILEEIVGDIHDEYDEKMVPIPEQQEDGTYLVDGRMPIWDVNNLLDTEISEEEDFDTLGGYISTFLGKIPEQGAHVETDQLIVDVKEANPRRIVQLAIRKQTASDQQEKNGA